MAGKFHARNAALSKADIRISERFGRVDAGLAGYLAVLTLAPLWYGSVISQAQIGNCAALSLLGLWIGARFDQTGIDNRIPRLLLLSAALFVAALCWALVQTSTLSPAKLHHPLWSAAGDALGQHLPGRISLNPERTWAEIGSWLATGLTFLVGYTLARDHAHARMILGAVGAAAAIYSSYGILDVVTGTNRVLFTPKNPYTLAQGINYVSATFINQDHYAAFAGIGVITLAGRLITDIAAAWPENAASWPTRLRRTLKALPKAGLGSAILLLPCLIGLVLSTSRAGLGCTLAGLAVLLALQIFRSGSRRAALIGVAALVAVLLIVVDLAGFMLAKRMSRLAESLGFRVQLYSLVVEAIRSNPWAGFGLGGFEDYFPLYRDARVGYTGIWNAAHNSYLELMSTLGVPAALALIGAAAMIVGRCAVGAVTRRRHASPALVATAASAQLVIHSLFDFPLQTEAIALTYAALLGCGLAQAYRTKPADRKPVRGKTAQVVRAGRR